MAEGVTYLPWQVPSSRLSGTTRLAINHIANLADFSKPPVKISYPQQMAVSCTGLIWSRYSMVIIPKNWNLFSVNLAMAGTGLYQLAHKIKHDYFPEREAAVARE